MIFPPDLIKQLFEAHQSNVNTNELSVKRMRIIFKRFLNKKIISSS